MSLSTDGSPIVAIDPDGIGVLARQISDAHVELASAAAGVRSALSALGLPTSDALVVGEIAGWLGDQVAGLQRRRVLADEAGRLMPWAPGVGPLVTIDETLAMRFPFAADPTAAGRAAAQRLRAGLADGKIDADVVAELQQCGRDGHYALAFAQEMGAADLAAVGTRLALMRQELERSSMSLADPPAERAALQAQSLAALEAVGVTFATATRGTPDVALPPEFAGQLLGELDHNAFGLSQLLRFGDHDTAFLDRISTGVLDYERNNAERGHWRSQAERMGGGPLPLIDDGGVGFWDPMVGVMTAVARNPVAAQNLLADPGRLEYFAAKRVWSADNGESFGKTLEAATTYFRGTNTVGAPVDPSRAFTSASIASAAQRYLASTGGENHMYSNLRDSVGVILGSYIADVARANAAGDTDVPVGVHQNADGTFGADLRRSDVVTLMGKAFGDTMALATLQAAAANYRHITGDLSLGFIGEQGPQLLPPAGTDPNAVNDWWNDTDPVTRHLLITEHPEVIGNLGGIPPSDRNEANHLALDAGLAKTRADIDALASTLDVDALDADPQAVQQLADLRERLAYFESVEHGVNDAERKDAGTGQVPFVQLLILDPNAFSGRGRAALSFGDTSTADNVVYCVPGLDQSVHPNFYRTVGNAQHLQEAAVARGTGSVATVAWLGYDAPGWGEVALRHRAESGADRLALDLRALRAIRPFDDPHLTVVGHSYGSTLVGIAARRYADLGIDDVVLVGSPGAGTDDVTQLHVPRDHVWVGAASGDAVAQLQQFGPDPASFDFGTRFDAETPQRTGNETISEHSHYYDADSESLMNISRVVAGLQGNVVVAPDRTYRYLSTWLDDPEIDRPIVPQHTDSTSQR